MVMPLSTVQVRMASVVYKDAKRWPGQGVGRQLSLLSLPIAAQETLFGSNPAADSLRCPVPALFAVGCCVVVPKRACADHGKFSCALLLALGHLPTQPSDLNDQPVCAAGGSASRRARTLFVLHFLALCLYRTCCGM